MSRSRKRKTSLHSRITPAEVHVQVVSRRLPPELFSRLTTNLDVLRETVQKLAPVVIPDFQEIWDAWAAAIDRIAGPGPRYTELEGATWALQSRFEIVAYLVGVEIGRRMGGAQ